jgi:flagellar protein FlaG
VSIQVFSARVDLPYTIRRDEHPLCFTSLQRERTVIMDSPLAIPGQRSTPDAVAVRLPANATMEAAPVKPVQAPPAQPRVSYDPAKLRENLQAAVEHLNKQIASTGRSLGFSMDEVINHPVVTVRSTQTGEVIRQIPSEAIVRIAHTLDELKGLLHDAVG